MTGLSSVGLARQALVAARAAARHYDGGQKTKQRQQPRPVRTVRRDRRELMDPGRRPVRRSDPRPAIRRSPASRKS
ncbi:hypothetical protein ACFVT5_41800 [Streptomyces sp. NPDC058001]|uniref:hypothetical protein n=1 Tax=Streptomyces sp. NPDC058001 TaxID=3346300 RepID=UPI0036E1F029